MILNYLDISFVHLVEKIFDAIVIFAIVHHDETNVSSSDESANKPLVKLVNNFQMHICGFPDMLID